MSDLHRPASRPSRLWQPRRPALRCAAMIFFILFGQPAAFLSLFQPPADAPIFDEA